MARPTKQGIEYFPLDCQFDDKIEMYLIEKEAIGLAVIITIWQLIYQNEGYYIEKNDDLLLLIKKRINVNINEINDCINVCIRRNIFEKKMYEQYNILTSKAIQKRFFDIAKRKKIVSYNIKYIINGVNVCNNAVNVCNNATKEKVKEKVKVNEYIYSSFYDSELKKKHSEKYLSFVKFLYGENELGEKLKGILSIEKQLTIEQFEIIANLAQSVNKLVMDELLTIENGGYFKKKKSLYLTLNKWLKNEKYS